MLFISICLYLHCIIHYFRGQSNLKLEFPQFYPQKPDFISISINNF